MRALLETRIVHPGRTLRAHFTVLTQSNCLSARRVDDQLRPVGLSVVADQRVEKFPLGGARRLDSTATLLRDPDAFIVNKSVNGFDTHGMACARYPLRGLVTEGGAVLIGSHRVGEMSTAAGEVVMLG